MGVDPPIGQMVIEERQDSVNLGIMMGEDIQKPFMFPEGEPVITTCFNDLPMHSTRVRCPLCGYEGHTIVKKDGCDQCLSCFLVFLKILLIFLFFALIILVIVLIVLALCSGKSSSGGGGSSHNHGDCNCCICFLGSGNSNHDDDNCCCCC